MALRVKNIAAGFYDTTGFHPIRSSADYNAHRGGDASGLQYAGKRKRAVARRKKKPSGRKPRPVGHKRAARKRNPISTKWTTARVRRTGRGDVQVMLFPKRRRR